VFAFSTGPLWSWQPLLMSGIDRMAPFHQPSNGRGPVDRWATFGGVFPTSPRRLRHNPAALADAPEFEYLIGDSTIVRAYQHAASAKGGLKIRPLADREAA
jgi:hypothetical protein